MKHGLRFRFSWSEIKPRAALALVSARRFVVGWRQPFHLLVIGIIVGGLAAPLGNYLYQQSRYRLTAAAQTLVGQTNATLASQITYNSATDTYQFNKDAVKDASVPATTQQTTVGTPTKGKATYAVDLPADMSRGITYHETNAQLSFSLVPQFSAADGHQVKGQLIYPLDSGAQAVYTLKGNGLKEDIVLGEAPASGRASYSYTLKLPKSLEARLIPNGQGAIGLYSVDPTLLGNISAGSAADQATLAKAQVSGAKTNLLFAIPAPVVKAAGHTASSAHAAFALSGDTLTVTATGLRGLAGPISIDPSVVVTSTSDFQSGGNNESNIDFSTSGQITRGALTGGTISGGWTSTASLSYVSEQGASATYNGYLYYMGGRNRNTLANYTTVSYAQLNTNGTITSWNTTAPLPATAGCVYATAVAYGGYLYVLGGDYGGSCATVTSAVYYAPINSNGTLGSWSTTTSMAAAVSGLAVSAYNGYMYALGGSSSNNPPSCNGAGTCVSTGNYAPINADGTLGSWTATPSLPHGWAYGSAVANNGYLYLSNGIANTGDPNSSIKDVYARINSDGSLGSWVTMNGLVNNAGRYAAALYVYNGYLYIANGYNTINDVEYAPIYANGNIGSWTVITAAPYNSTYSSGQAYNGYLYFMAGYDGTNDHSDVNYAKIDPAGQPVPFATLSNNFTTARANSCSVAYNGYLYAIGGSTTDSGNQNVTTVQYTALNSSGGNGTWSSTTVLPVARGNESCVAANGYLYVLGGYTGTGVGGGTSSILYISIASSGALGASWSTGPNGNPNSPVRGGLFTYGTSSGTYLYSLGGCTTPGSGHGCEYTYYTPLNVSTGAPGGWTQASNMVGTDETRAYAQVGKYLYAFGGQDSNTPTVTAAAEYTSINNDGSLATWTLTTSMNTAIGYGGATAINGCIYYMGGENAAGTSQATVQYACPAANGSISAWTTAPSLSVATTDMGVASYNGYLYGVGGYTSSVQTTTQSAFVNNGGGGNNGAWAAATGGLATSVTDPANTAYNNYLYAVGGQAAGSGVNSVQYSAIGASGDLGAFTTDSHTFTTGRQLPASVAYNGYLYVLGGENPAATSYYGDVQYAPIGSSGALSGNFATTNSFVTGTGSDTGRAGTCAVAYNGYMYALGGWDGTNDHNDTRYTPINADGSLGAWTDASLTGSSYFSTARSNGSCFVANGYLYMLGGNGATNYNDVQSVQIKSNGTLGTWNYTTSFPTPRQNFTTGVSNGFAYIIGGCNNATTCNTGSALGDTEYAPILSNGTLGPWQQATPTLSSTYKESDGVAAVYNGYLYGGGGYGNFNGSSMYYAPLSNTLGRQAQYSRLVDLGTPESLASVSYNGTVPSSGLTPGVAPVTMRVAGSNGVFGSATSTAITTSANATSCTVSSQNYVRYVLLTVTLDDTAGSSIFPDAAGTAANLTDFTVNYITPHPATNIRLRTGQTFQTGNISALDLCGQGTPVVRALAYGMTPGGNGGSEQQNLAVQAGDYLFGVVAEDDSDNSVSGGGTWTSLESNHTSDNGGYLHSFTQSVSSGGTNSYSTTTTDASDRGLIVLALTGYQGSSLVRNSTTSVTNSATTATFPTVSANAGDLVLHIITWHSGTNAGTIVAWPPSGETAIMNNTDTWIGLAGSYYAATTTGTTSAPTVTFSAAQSAVLETVVIAHQ